MQDEMQKVVIAGCGHEEYYGDVYWLSGVTVCRKCMYDIWEKNGADMRCVDKTYIFPVRYKE